VTDSGLRVSDEVAAKIFESFFTTKGVKNGTGLGLSICRDILTNMKGTIELNPKAKNMEFIIKLPVAI